MIGALAAVVLSASDANPPVVDLVVAAKKKKKTGGTKAKPEETSEGLDLTASEPVTKTPESTPTEAPPSAESEVAKGEESSSSGGAGAFSVVTPTGAGEGGNVIEAAVGWPGVYAAYWRGLIANLDVGARVGFNWSPEGHVIGGAIITPGLKIQLQGRYNIVKVWKADIGVEVAPGFIMYFPGGFRGSWPGFIISVAGVAGMNVMEKLNVGVRLEVPFFMIFGTLGGAAIPIMVGGGAEYALAEQILLQARVKAGVGLWTNAIGPVFAFEALVGAAYKL